MTESKRSRKQYDTALSLKPQFQSIIKTVTLLLIERSHYQGLITNPCLLTKQITAQYNYVTSLWKILWAHFIFPHGDTRVKVELACRWWNSFSFTTWTSWALKLQGYSRSLFLFSLLFRRPVESRGSRLQQCCVCGRPPTLLTGLVIELQAMVGWLGTQRGDVPTKSKAVVSQNRADWRGKERETRHRDQSCLILDRGFVWVCVKFCFITVSDRSRSHFWPTRGFCSYCTDWRPGEMKRRAVNTFHICATPSCC